MTSKTSHDELLGLVVEDVLSEGLLDDALLQHDEFIAELGCPHDPQDEAAMDWLESFARAEPARALLAFLGAQHVMRRWGRPPPFVLRHMQALGYELSEAEQEILVPPVDEPEVA